MGRPFVSIRYHFVWSTRGREPWVTSDLAPHVFACIRAKCVELGAVPLAVGGIEDHVHLVVGAPASLTPSVLVGQVKGVSSHYINHALRTTQPFEWQKGYGVFTVSRSHETQVQTYVLDQRRRHAQNQLWLDLERDEDEADR